MANTFSDSVPSRFSALFGGLWRGTFRVRNSDTFDHDDDLLVKNPNPIPGQDEFAFASENEAIVAACEEIRAWNARNVERGISPWREHAWMPDAHVIGHIEAECEIYEDFEKADEFEWQCRQDAKTSIGTEY